MVTHEEINNMNNQALIPTGLTFQESVVFSWSLLPTPAKAVIIIGFGYYLLKFLKKRG